MCPALPSAPAGRRGARSPGEWLPRMVAPGPSPFVDGYGPLAAGVPLPMRVIVQHARLLVNHLRLVGGRTIDEQQQGHLPGTQLMKPAHSRLPGTLVVMVGGGRGEADGHGSVRPAGQIDGRSVRVSHSPAELGPPSRRIWPVMFTSFGHRAPVAGWPPPQGCGNAGLPSLVGKRANALQVQFAGGTPAHFAGGDGGAQLLPLIGFPFPGFRSPQGPQRAGDGVKVALVAIAVDAHAVAVHHCDQRVHALHLFRVVLQANSG